MKERESAPALTIEDIAKDPHRFGLPTYAEFQKNPARWRKRSDANMIALSEGPTNNRKNLKRIRYFIHGVELPNEESVEKALGDYGYTLDDIDLEKRDSRLKKEINNVPVGGGLDHDVHVNFLP